MNSNISTGFKKFDTYIKDIPKNALVYICARPGIGLKTFSNNILDDIEFSEIKVRFQTIALFDLCKENEITIYKMEQKVKKENSDVVYMQSLQYIDTDTKYDNKVQKVSEISYQLKQMANELSTLVICTMQLPPYEGKPSLHYLNNFGSMVQDADVIMFLHRDDFTGENIGSIDTDISELIIAKNRYGDTGTIKLKYNLETNQFTEVDTL